MKLTARLKASTTPVPVTAPLIEATQPSGLPTHWPLDLMAQLQLARIVSMETSMDAYSECLTVRVEYRVPVFSILESKGAP